MNSKSPTNHSHNYRHRYNHDQSNTKILKNINTNTPTKAESVKITDIVKIDPDPNTDARYARVAHLTA